MFAASDVGGGTLNDAISIIETTKMSGLNPEADVAYVLARIHNHMNLRLDEPRPGNCDPSHIPAVRTA